MYSKSMARLLKYPLMIMMATAGIMIYKLTRSNRALIRNDFYVHLDTNGKKWHNAITLVQSFIVVVGCGIASIGTFLFGYDYFRELYKRYCVPIPYEE